MRLKFYAKSTLVHVNIKDNSFKICKYYLNQTHSKNYINEHYIVNNDENIMGNNWICYKCLH